MKVQPSGRPPSPCWICGADRQDSRGVTGKRQGKCRVLCKTCKGKPVSGNGQPWYLSREGRANPVKATHLPTQPPKGKAVRIVCGVTEHRHIGDRASVRPGGDLVEVVTVCKRVFWSPEALRNHRRSNHGRWAVQEPHTLEATA